MGLDITAYSNLRPVGKHTDHGQWCEDDSHVRAFTYDCFPASFRGIPVLSTVTPGDGSTPFADGGCYQTTDTTKTYGFRAGSYHGYNLWRADLATQFNPQEQVGEGLRSHYTEPDPDKPFYELIWFADNEGCIGPEAAADLVVDFREHADVYAPAQHEDYFRQKYADWTRACELAAANGLIDFH